MSLEGVPCGDDVSMPCRVREVHENLCLSPHRQLDDVVQVSADRSVQVRRLDVDVVAQLGGGTDQRRWLMREVM